MDFKKCPQCGENTFAEGHCNPCGYSGGRPRKEKSAQAPNLDNMIRFLEALGDSELAKIKGASTDAVKGCRAELAALQAAARGFPVQDETCELPLGAFIDHWRAKRP